MLINNTEALLRYSHKPIRQVQCFMQACGRVVAQCNYDKVHMLWMPGEVLSYSVIEAFKMLKQKLFWLFKSHETWHTYVF